MWDRCKGMVVWISHLGSINEVQDGSIGRYPCPKWNRRNLFSRSPPLSGTILLDFPNAPVCNAVLFRTQTIYLAFVLRMMTLCLVLVKLLTRMLLWNICVALGSRKLASSFLFKILACQLYVTLMVPSPFPLGIRYCVSLVFSYVTMICPLCRMANTLCIMYRKSISLPCPCGRASSRSSTTLRLPRSPCLTWDLWWTTRTSASTSVRSCVQLFYFRKMFLVASGFSQKMCTVFIWKLGIVVIVFCPKPVTSRLWFWYLLRCNEDACQNFPIEHGNKINTAAPQDVHNVLFLNSKLGFSMDYLKFHAALEFRAYVPARTAKCVYKSVFSHPLNSNWFRVQHA